MSSTSAPEATGTPDAPSPTAASSELTPMPEVAGSHSAQPSISSLPDALSANVDDVANAAGIYGTRSRKSGRARPNYADDKDIDAEIEAAGRYSASKSKKSQAIPAPPAATQEADMSSTHNGFAAVNGSAPLVTQINGTHAPVPQSSGPSKKRKQPGSNITVSAAQPSPPPASPMPFSRSPYIETNVMSFDDSKALLNKKQQLVTDDGITIAINDHMYFICEPPGEPYYFGRIMEFLHVGDTPDTPVEAVRVNWFYRPKDIQRRVQDTRVVFASMHSDTCPLASMRGKCYIRHLADIPDLDEYRKQPDAFWFDKLYDRYMLRYYEVIPTAKVVNVPRHVKKVLDERWKFILVEVGRGRDLTSASKMCKRCGDFAANHESVDCAVCKNTYHMSCVRPPLLKKPARGFAWACAACSRAQELKMEARNTPMSETELSRLAEADDDEEEASQIPDQMTRDNSVGAEEHPEPTKAQLAQANLWPWRYLGIHARPEDALDYDDRIYPRASSRLGPRHQANVNVWYGRPVEFIKASEGKKKYRPTTGNKKDGKSTVIAENDKRAKRPKWVYDEPPGYIPRGGDEPSESKGKKEYTSQLTFKMPDPSKFTERGLDDDERPGNYGDIVDAYLQRCDKEVAPRFNLQAGNVDVRTKGLEKLQENNYDVDQAMAAMRKITARTDLKLPELTKDEIKRFEEGVSKYGSELHLVARHVSPTIKESRIVRFYYVWKKTERGREIWGNFEGRKSKKDSKRVEKDAGGARLLDDVADDGDDSAFDIGKAYRVKRGFKCKYCTTTTSRIWRRAPATAPGTLVPPEPATKSAKDKSNWLVSALCGKCAYLWRRYAVQYESIEEIGKKIAVAGGRAAKRKVDEELMRLVLEAQTFSGDTVTKATAQIATTAGIEVPASMIESDEPANKKKKGEATPIPPEVIVDKKKFIAPIELEPLKPEMPKVKEHPCAVCHIINHAEHKMLKCRDCRLHVHAPCYGVVPPVDMGPWYCDMCKNDHNTQVSTNYECVLCPVRRTPQELMEPPKVTHKKKTDREREKERAEREMVNEAGRRWREDQMAAGRPVDPREPLKRTAWNNWVHVNCAVWCKEIKFGDANNLDTAEGIGFIPRERFEAPCKFCSDTNYPTITCQFTGCGNTFHIGCAHQKGLTLGFDISPVKVSRRDSVPIMRLDTESGLAIAGVWCLHHAVQTIVHNMLEQTPSGLTALQEFVRTYKQVDSTITGTVRRAQQFETNIPSHIPSTAARRTTMNGHAYSAGQGDAVRSPSPLTNGDSHAHAISTPVKSEKKCCTCTTLHSPKWWKVEPSTPKEPAGAELPTLPLPHTLDSGRNTYDVKPPALNIKPEPVELDTMTVPEEILWQCHKCHTRKRTPPPSPTIVRKREPQRPPVVEDIPSQAAIHPLGGKPTLPHPLETTSHSHPAMHPPPVYAGASLWPGPAYGNGVHPPILYQHPGPFPPRSNEYGSFPTYGNDLPGMRLPVWSASGPSSSRMNGVQHSPPPLNLALGQQPPTLHTGQPPSPRFPTLNGPNPFASSQPAPFPPYRSPLGIPFDRPRAGSITAPQSISHARRPSQDANATPRMGTNRQPTAVIDLTESPRMSHVRPEETPREADGSEKSAAPGASASPSLRNLLS